MPKKENLTKQQVLSVKKTRLVPSLAQWRQLPRLLTPREQRLFFGAILLAFISIVAMGIVHLVTNLNDQPAVGGRYTEGLIGEPRFINPLYASANDVDGDLTKLIYSGLLKWDPEQGLVPDLATRLEISEDEKTYTLTLREDALFHNGEPVRARDVLFTMQAIQNPLYRSPAAGNFQEVLISQVDDSTISFELASPRASFLSALTVGILPADVWADIPPKNAPLASTNLEPIGSGPYMFDSFTKDKKGSIRSYLLTRNASFYEQPPFVEELEFKFYPDTGEAVSALSAKHIEGLSVIPFEDRASLADTRGVQLVSPQMPRQIVLFFNQEENADLKKESLRKAIAHAINKQTLVEETLIGDARVLDTPLVPLSDLPEIDILSYNKEEATTLITPLLKVPEQPEPEEETSEEDTADVAEEATPTLELSLTTSNTPEFITVAEAIKRNLEAIGITLTINAIDQEVFFTSVIEPRNFDLLLAGILYGIEPDPYSFWHSSQKESGLNVTGYSNSTVDGALETARTTTNIEDQQTAFETIVTEITEDLPAVFLYQSNYVFAHPTRLRGVQVNQIVSPADRFARVGDWYLKTAKQLN